MPPHCKRGFSFARHVAEPVVFERKPVTQLAGRQAVSKGVFGNKGV